MLELLLSLDHEASKLFDWLEPQEILKLTCVNHALHQACEQWCETRGVPRQVAMKRAEIAGICECFLEQTMQEVPHQLSIRTSLEFHEPRTKEIGLALVFQSYQGFLEALLRTPLDDTVVNLSSWSKRYWMVSRPRPPAIRQRFDYGYPSTGYWCDAFGCGAPNDYFRLVDDDLGTYWSICLAGSDVSHIRWRYASNNDRSLDPVLNKSSSKSCTQKSQAP
eukprot:CAMPEP_0113643864 /NCGR_PEP_ID=MMETSP0017_2-20120614/23075_1 /TAXON_ID=2856 /ORGANISM="Cylindrotheca closterium" /LENGTH=220 /DNA_ID=CAMNT_0000555423 /DNA_START=86 /DNA_END=744 /DNA_ORIENTATION=- /assembly_acc=CAM_ASM_000147